MDAVDFHRDLTVQSSRNSVARYLSFVMPGLVPGIHVFERFR
jgi:hypothetical protein